MKNAKLLVTLIGGLSLPLAALAADYEKPSGSAAVSSDTGAASSGPQTSSEPFGARGRKAELIFDPSMFEELDANKDGYIDGKESEASAASKTKFTDFDTNRDGLVSRGEWMTGASGDVSSQRR